MLRWIKQLFYPNSRAVSTSAKRAPLALLLEQLEDRCTPATLTVLNTSDALAPAAGSLRAVIAAAQAGDIIVFDAGMQNQTIDLVASIDISRSLTIIGSGQCSATIGFPH